MIDIVINESLVRHIGEYDGIVIGTNCYQSMRHGFQYEISEKYPCIKKLNYATKYGDDSKLGSIVECKEDNHPTLILAFLTFGYNFKGNDSDFFDYNALAKVFGLLNILYRGKHLATTMLGCSEYDGNADREKVINILNSCITSFSLTIYDYRQESHRDIRQKAYLQSIKRKLIQRKKSKLCMNSIPASKKPKRLSRGESTIETNPTTTLRN